MGLKGLVALATATIALLVGPGAAFGQDAGTAGAPADPTVADSTVTQEQQPADTTGGGDTSSVTDTTNDVSTSSDPVVDTSSTPATDTTDTDSTGSAVTEPAATDQSQPQVETSVATADVRTATATKSGGSNTCGLRTAAAGGNGNGVGPPGPGCTRVDGGQISKDPANPTVLPAINGVVVAIWIVDTASGPEVHWQVQSGTFSGTDAINLKVKGGPDPNGFTCQVTNTATSGICHAPLNLNNGKWYGVSHVDACPGSTTTPPVNTPPGGGPSGGVAGQVQKGGQNKNGGAVSPEVGGGAAPALAAAVSPGGGLPVTGMPALWLFLIGGALLAGGALVRIRIN